MRTFAVETIRTLPRLTRLGQINDHTRISLGRIISEQSTGSPDGEFLLFDGRVHTYEAVDRRINNVVRGLIDVGVRQGDHVGVLMETRPSALVAIAALSRLGAVAVLMPPDGDLVEAARLGGVAEILTDPTNLDAARQLSLQVLVLGGGESRDLHLSDNADVIDMEQIDPDAVELPGWYRPNPGFARDLAFIAFSTVGGELVAKQITNYRWALSAFGTASAAALSRERHRLLPDAAASPVRPAGEPRRGGCRRSPRRPVPWPAARTASCRRSASTASPWSATPGRCSATSSTSPASSCTVTIRCGCSSVRACRRGCGSGSSRRSHRLAWWSSSRPPTGRPSSPTCRAPRSAARAGRCPAAARSNSRPTTPTPDLILEDDRGFVQVAATDQVGVLLARPRGPVDPTASVKRGVFAPADTWISTESLFRRDADGDYWLVGSRSAVIQTARGVVFAEPVTDAVGRIGAVDLAVTYGVTRGGDDQVAITAITLRPGTSVTAADLTEAVAAMPVGLPPDVVHVVADLPLSATYRPVVGGLRNAGIPRAGRQAWYLDRDNGRFKRLTSEARADLAAGVSRTHVTGRCRAATALLGSP